MNLEDNTSQQGPTETVTRDVFFSEKLGSGRAISIILSSGRSGMLSSQLVYSVMKFFHSAGYKNSILQFPNDKNPFVVCADMGEDKNNKQEHAISMNA